MTPTAPLLAVRDLSVRFDIEGSTVVAVDGVSFEIGRGEIVAVVGESGSGKSVSALAMLGLLEKTATATGSIAFGEHDLLTLAPDALQALRGRKIAMIFQDAVASLDPVFTIGFQLAETIRLHDPSLSRRSVRARALELLEAVDIVDPQVKLKQYPHQLSGGQCQRIMIALALVSEPDLLIADEPTTALDVSVQAGILDLLHDLRARSGTAVMIITHDMGVVADLADRVVVMRSGHVVETGDAVALFDRPTEHYTRELLAAVPRVGQADDAPSNAGRSDGGAASVPVLEISDLCVDYRSPSSRHKVRVVHDVSLSLHAGEIVALVGESGSGKSTIGKAAVGLAPVASGRILMNGSDTATMSRAERTALRHRVGIIFQNPATSLNPRYTIGDTLEEPLRRIAGVRGSELRERIARLLDAVGISESWASRYPHELSGGQRQRVAIARAVSLGPELLIADEPTSALDVTVQAHVLDTLRGLQANLGFACLFISHDLAVVDSLADRVAVLNHGRLVEEASRADLFTRPRDDYTRTLLAAAPVPDPVFQRARRLSR
ncbi:MAG: glutathione transporter ATP-binding protein [Frondihabitans sp.]|nr:glutathione transporter ATP-binding protein [Frondihabitans sp.]